MHNDFTLYHSLLNAFESDPEHVAIIDGQRQYSYAQLVAHAEVGARHLIEAGIQRGERVGIHLDKSWEAVASMFAVMRAGAVFVNISTQLKQAQVAHIIDDCDVRALIADTSAIAGLELPRLDVVLDPINEPTDVAFASRVVTFLDDVDSHEPLGEIPACTSADLCTIIYTSGSTGLPKGIMLSQHNLLAGARIVSTYLENTSQDCLISILPLHFDAGLNQLTTMIHVGGTLVLQRSLLPGDILTALREHRVTGIGGVPSVWLLVLQARRSIMSEPLTHLRYISNTGGQIPQDNLDRLRTVLPDTDIVLMYGLTEAFRSTYLPPADLDKGTSCIGRAIPDTDVRVVDPDGNECAVGVPGELIHRGPTVALGYWGNPEKTAEVYKPNPFAPPELQPYDMVVYSGDLVRRDEDGYLYYVGRRDELIKVQGHRVSPLEVEEILHAHSGVKVAAVFGRGRLEQGQQILAIVSPNAGVELAPGDLRSFVQENAPAHLVPSEIVVLDDLPTTTSGKVDRATLRSTYADG